MTNRPFRKLTIKSAKNKVPLTSRPRVFRHRFQKIRTRKVLPNAKLNLTVTGRLVATVKKRLSLVDPIPPSL